MLLSKIIIVTFTLIASAFSSFLCGAEKYIIEANEVKRESFETHDCFLYFFCESKWINSIAYDIVLDSGEKFRLSYKNWFEDVVESQDNLSNYYIQTGDLIVFNEQDLRQLNWNWTSPTVYRNGKVVGENHHFLFTLSFDDQIIEKATQTQKEIKNYMKVGYFTWRHTELVEVWEVCVSYDIELDNKEKFNLKYSFLYDNPITAQNNFNSYFIQPGDRIIYPTTYWWACQCVRPFIFREKKLIGEMNHLLYGPSLRPE